MSTIEPTPLHDCPPYSVLLGADGQPVTLPETVRSPTIVPRVVPSLEDALLALFAAFPDTQILE